MGANYFKKRNQSSVKKIMKKPFTKFEWVLIGIISLLIGFLIGFISGRRILYEYKVRPLLNENTRVMDDCGGIEECE